MKSETARKLVEISVDMFAELSAVKAVVGILRDNLSEVEGGNEQRIYSADTLYGVSVLLNRLQSRVEELDSLLVSVP